MKNDQGSVQSHDHIANSYDDQTREYGWYGHEILFGMCFEYISSNSKLLDIGIGTGLSSSLFANAGLEIYGIDGSVEMLHICKTKNIAKELKQYDLNDLPLPYSNSLFQHVISCGVFHFIGDLEPIFRDVSRIIKPGGFFSFTVKAENYDRKIDYSQTNDMYYSERSPEGVEVFAHRKQYIKSLLQLCHLEELKEQLFLVQNAQENNYSTFSAHVVKYKK
ncbi:MAG: class I SAM-dependent methyltransferase [Firmicutes bacterium HGW-Firmicutes-7]|nr:MAG: class I SAM-dependent methyltransferase [Firmicutes bacterium HGW-Firmicutes-7]